MKAFFAATFGLLVILSAIAWKIAPRAVEDGKMLLIWVSDDNPRRPAQIAPFNQLHPQYNLKLDPTNGGMEKVIVQSLAGVGPDLFDCYDAFQLSAYVKAGIAWDITDEWEKLGVDVRRETWAAVHPDCIYEGRIYGFPTNAAVNGIWFHKELFREAGMPAPSGPWSWADFLKVAQKLTLRDPSGKIIRYGFLCDWQQNWLQFVMQSGGALYSPDGTRCTIDSPQSLEALQFLHDLIYKWRISPNPAEETAMSTQGGWGSGTISLFGGRRGAMAIGGRWWLCTLREYHGLNLGATEAPYSRNRIFRGYGKATLINKASPRREQAMDWLKYFRSEQYNNIINNQADGVGPMIRYTQTDAFLHNPQHPEEDYNAVWRTMQLAAIPDPTSPFVNGPTVNRIINKQLDLMRANEKPIAQGLADMARQINEHIQETLRRDPQLSDRYEQLQHPKAPDVYPWAPRKVETQ